ncbi:MAG: hypothetical protein ACLR1R_04165 [Ruminococcus callidus]
MAAGKQRRFRTRQSVEKLLSRSCGCRQCSARKWSIDRTIHELEKQCLPYVENWQNSHWLKGQLVLFLDEEMNGN